MLGLGRRGLKQPGKPLRRLAQGSQAPLLWLAGRGKGLQGPGGQGRQRAEPEGCALLGQGSSPHPVVVTEAMVRPSAQRVNSTAQSLHNPQVTAHENSHVDWGPSARLQRAQPLHSPCQEPRHSESTWLFFQCIPSRQARASLSTEVLTQNSYPGTCKNEMQVL